MGSSPRRRSASDATLILFAPGEFIALTRLFSAEETRVDLEMWYLFMITEAGTYMAQRVVVWVVKGCLERLNLNLNLNLNFESSRRTRTFRERSPPPKWHF